MTVHHSLPRHIKGSTGIFNDISAQTSQRISDALDKIYEQHDIVPNSPVGILLRNGITKLIVGMHHLHDAINQLNDELPNESKLSSRASIKRLFYEDFLKACNAENGASNSSVERILLIEMGRTRVVSNTLYKLRELTGKDLREGFKILGSLVRQTIDIYRELGGAEFNFSKNPPTHRQQIVEQLKSLRNNPNEKPKLAA